MPAAAEGSEPSLNALTSTARAELFQKHFIVASACGMKRRKFEGGPVWLAQVKFGARFGCVRGRRTLRCAEARTKYGETTRKRRPERGGQ